MKTMYRLLFCLFFVARFGVVEAVTMTHIRLYAKNAVLYFDKRGAKEKNNEARALKKFSNTPTWDAVKAGNFGVIQKFNGMFHALHRHILDAVTHYNAYINSKSDAAKTGFKTAADAIINIIEHAKTGEAINQTRGANTQVKIAGWMWKLSDLVRARRSELGIVESKMTKQVVSEPTAKKRAILDLEDIRGGFGDGIKQAITAIHNSFAVQTAWQQTFQDRVKKAFGPDDIRYKAISTCIEWIFQIRHAIHLQHDELKKEFFQDLASGLQQEVSDVFTPLTAKAVNIPGITSIPNRIKTIKTEVDDLIAFLQQQKVKLAASALRIWGNYYHKIMWVVGSMWKFRMTLQNELLKKEEEARADAEEPVGATLSDEEDDEEDDDLGGSDTLIIRKDVPKKSDVQQLEATVKRLRRARDAWRKKAKALEVQLAASQGG